jgi:hypothetical protein
VGSWWREELLALAELAALVGFAVVQPVLGPFGESPETLFAFGVSDADVVRFGIVVVAVPLLAIASLALASRLLGREVRSIVQTALVAGLAGLAGVYVVRDLGSSGFSLGTGARIVGGIVAVAVVAVLHRRSAVFRSFLRFAAVVPVVLLVSFLRFSPVGQDLRPLLQAMERAAGEARPTRAPDPDAPPSVVFIMLDELPTLSLTASGEIDADLFPNLAEFAATSTWYRNHTSVGPETMMAVPPIVTGQLSPGPNNGFPTYDDYPRSMFTLLAPTHRVHATEWTSNLCPPDVCSSAPPKLDEEAIALAPHLVDAESATAGEQLVQEATSLWWDQVWPTNEPPRREAVAPALEAAEGRVGPAVSFLSGLEDAGDGWPVLDYLHAPLPHAPWNVLPSGDAYDAPDEAAGFLYWGDDEAGEVIADVSRARHLLQLQWVDRYLGEVFDRLQSLDRWDDAVVVVTADHGVAFDPATSSRTLTPQNHVEVAWTPLFVKAPGQATGAIDDSNVMSIDVLPTVAALAGVAIPWDVDGRSLLGDPRTDQEKWMPPRGGRRVRHALRRRAHRDPRLRGAGRTTRRAARVATRPARRPARALGRRDRRMWRGPDRPVRASPRLGRVRL